MQTQGQPEDYILNRGRGTEDYFHRQRNNQRMWTFKTPDEFHEETGETTEDTRFYQLSSLDELEQFMEINSGSQRDQQTLVDLIRRMLHLDPDLRIQPLEVLQHPFFNRSLRRRSSSPDICINMMDTEEAEPEVSNSPFSLQSSGPGSNRQQCSSTHHPNCQEPVLIENYPAETEDNNQEEDNIQPDTNRNNNRFKRFFKWIRRPFQCCCAGYADVS